MAKKKKELSAQERVDLKLSAETYREEWREKDRAQIKMLKEEGFFRSVGYTHISPAIAVANEDSNERWRKAADAEKELSTAMAHNAETLPPTAAVEAAAGRYLAAKKEAPHDEPGSFFRATAFSVTDDNQRREYHIETNNYELLRKKINANAKHKGFTGGILTTMFGTGAATVGAASVVGLAASVPILSSTAHAAVPLAGGLTVGATGGIAYGGAAALSGAASLTLGGMFGMKMEQLRVLTEKNRGTAQNDNPYIRDIAKYSHRNALKNTAAVVKSVFLNSGRGNGAENKWYHTLGHAALGLATAYTYAAWNVGKRFHEVDKQLNAFRTDLKHPNLPDKRKAWLDQEAGPELSAKIERDVQESWQERQSAVPVNERTTLNLSVGRA